MFRNVKLKSGPPTTRHSADELVARGYRRISNAHGLISRIDREDWLDVLANAMGRKPEELVPPDGSGRINHQWCDHYRRVYSKDVHVVDHARLSRIPTSSGDPVGYVASPSQVAKTSSTEAP